jgi:hypothetical protein
MRVKPFIAASKKKPDTRIKKWVLPIGLARKANEAERAREAERERERERERENARERERICICIYMQSFAVPMNAREWPTHLVYKRCRGGRVTVEL